MALRKRGLTFLICFRKRGVPRNGGRGSLRKSGVPTLEETMTCSLSLFHVSSGEKKAREHVSNQAVHM